MSAQHALSTIQDPAPAHTDAPAAGGKPMLIDLSKIDLSNRTIDREAIGRINPHRGQMALLDYIVHHTPDFKEGVALKLNRPDEFWVEGHIPRRPMLPGVIMVEAAAQLAVFLFNGRFNKARLAAFTHLDHCTFRSSVTVGDEFLIMCKEVKVNARRFVTEVQGVVGPRVIFEAQITGMLLG
ncbi:MAG: 3-hydroxyacyl-ACP dehydratase FabZ family protein [Phycisphaerales bacterium]